MRLVLKVQTVGLSPQPIWLSSGQTLTVGRNEEAQFVVATDLLMSRVHFEVSVEEEECWIVDRGSSNGTLLNRERIREARLKDGDEIQAGQTLFRVRLEPVIAIPNRRSPPESTPSVEPPRPCFTKKECSSGVVQIQLKKQPQQPVVESVTNPPNARPVALNADSEDENETAMPGVAPSWSDSESTIDERRTMELFPDGFSTPVEEFSRPEREETHPKPGTVAVLHLVSGSEIGRALRIGLGQSFSAGRLEHNDFALPNEYAMSGRHFQIEFTGGELVVHDLGSRNGTFVNGVPCKRAVLCESDRLMVGDAVFQVRFESIHDNQDDSQLAETVTELC